MTTIRKFEVQISPFSESEVSVYNNVTMNHAKQNLHSLWRIKKLFKVYLNNREFMTFSHFPADKIELLKNMLPDHTINAKDE
jgi:hypothetical protein